MLNTVMHTCDVLQNYEPKISLHSLTVFLMEYFATIMSGCERLRTRKSQQPPTQINELAVCASLLCRTVWWSLAQPIATRRSMSPRCCISPSEEDITPCLQGFWRSISLAFELSWPPLRLAGWFVLRLMCVSEPLVGCSALHLIADESFMSSWSLF